MTTRHADLRAKQRGIPPLIDQLLDRYGHEEYDGHGAISIFFDKRGRRQMAHDLGREPLRRMSEWLDAYKVISSRDGETITIGHRYKRINRR